MKYALIRNGVVENVVEWNGEGNLFSGYTCVNVDGVSCGPGWLYSDGAFTAPPENAAENN